MSRPSTMQTCIGKFFGRVDSAKKGELHSFLFEKEHAERGKRLRDDEERELAGIQEVRSLWRAGVAVALLT